jgi:hypothetical protein
MAVVRHFALNLVRVASAPLWTLEISWRYWGRWRVNLDSLPWAAGSLFGLLLLSAAGRGISEELLAYSRSVNPPSISSQCSP